MESGVSIEILDLRHFSAPVMRAVLEAEGELWRKRLHWDYRISAKLLMQYLDSHMLPGYAALEAGQVIGYVFCVYEETKAVVGDVFALPYSRPEAVAAAERIIGPGMLRDAHGHFWGVPETRPYMRARAALAQFLWETGERDAAIDHYNALLELNSNDNQGMRYILTGWLLEEGRDEDLDRLVKRFPDDVAATWQYDRALHFFRQEGPGKKAQKALRDALKQNPFVPDYLLGEKKLPRSLPALIDMGDENEAIDYADRAIPNWEKTPYALDWLRENAPTASS